MIVLVHFLMDFVSPYVIKPLIIIGVVAVMIFIKN
jgi:hypothetical protein